jgi:rfaE bifunctional protein nucleotidyltransferase chain/domain/rfaE bifunctional protein kinase chain/domain
MTAPLVVIGDTLLDRDVDGTVERLSPDAPVPVLEEQHVRTRAGGAGLAAALAATDGGREITLVTALADDEPGAELARLLEAAGVEVVDLGLEGRTPEKVRLRNSGRTLLRLDRGGRSGRVGRASATARAAIGWAPAILVADYAGRVPAEPGLRGALAERAAKGIPIAWDPHRHGTAPVPGVMVATPNEDEAAWFASDVGGDGLEAVATRAARLRARWGARHVCVTRGARGALLDGGDGPPLAVPTAALSDGDPCGAGDRFAARVAVLLAEGAGPVEAVLDAVRAASAFVAAGGAAGLRAGVRRRGGEHAADGRDAHGNRTPAEAADDAQRSDPLALARSVIAATRARGGTVVATGGCFDLLHTGHVHTLEAARALGDCLVVCLNSDASTRRLKGPARPLVREDDRAAVLRALQCVDAVAIFDEDTPEAILDRLRPDVWAKGGDYAGATLPEAAVLEQWGGRAVILPHFAGHSTTRLIEEAANRAAS